MGIKLTDSPSWGKLLGGTLVGYFIAVAAATLSATTMLIAQDIIRDGIQQNGWLIFYSFAEINLIGFAIIAMFAWPVFLPTIAFAHWKRIDSPLIFSIAGLITAIIAIWFADNPSATVNFSLSRIIRDLTAVWFALFGGMIGGLAYGFWHRRYFYRA